MEPTPKTPWWRESMMYFMRISTWIAGPILVSLFLGKWLDEKFETAPWIFVSLTGFGFLISMFGLVKESKTYMNQIAEEAKKAKEKNDGRTDTTTE